MTQEFETNIIRNLRDWCGKKYAMTQEFVTHIIWNLRDWCGKK